MAIQNLAIRDLADPDLAAQEWTGAAEQTARTSRESLEGKIRAARDLLRDRLDGATDACVTSSFQAGGVVILHLLSEIAPGIPVLFLDTGYHFQETLDYRDRLTERWSLNLINVLPESTVAEQESAFGILHRTAPDRCCAMRKVEPLFRALEDYRVWVTGLQRNQSRSRAHLRAEENFFLPGGHRLAKLNPLADWSRRDLWHYAEVHAVPLLPLYEQGYSSIGCAPCTSLPVDPSDPRSGRWNGQKQECGIHVQP
ncbi:MAG TPA: phosphoadenylyl-sulfate reductase [Acidobacteriaceae bacterium]